ncbi:hypothetical protein [Lutibacter flavus]|uniref:Uncharacterized protein n=1 Tax=Lutibacter flavus TaxID=691689 RepID=A0A238X4T3_9FLAO|nr:hypothetical protein [Lutibacter flavus]SNR54035.1 hypothetical protein SAMN04488111_1587 [Lutibacter flavus]
MSFGSGSIPGYLERLRNSKIRKANRQKEFRGGNNYSNVKNIKTEYNFPKTSGYNFSEIKKKIRKEALLENKKQLLFWIIGAVAVLIIILLFNYY